MESLLGLILFVIYINDLSDVVKSIIPLFTGDTKIQAPISSPHDVTLLQNNINNMAGCSDTWLLNFHSKKCYVLTIGKQQTQNAKRYTLKENELGNTLMKKMSRNENSIRKSGVVSGRVKYSFKFETTSLL